MPRTERYRALYVLKYLWEYTDDEHPATLAQIRGYLEAHGIKAIPRTIDKDIKELMSLGYDVMCSRGRQNQYHFALPHGSGREQPRGEGRSAEDHAL